MKLWQKENAISSEQSKLIEKFTVGKDKELDLLLAEFDVQGSVAHTQMLASIGLLTENELTLIHKELRNILEEIKAGKFKIEEGVEDVHSQVELLLTERIGEAGKKIHSGRSRNDQVLLDIKLLVRHELKQIVEQVFNLFNVLQNLSEAHKEKLLPGYTHFQVAMPSSFGLWFGAYAESLADDLEVMLAAYKVADKNPLGSGAGYGSSFPLDREMTTSQLGFSGMNYNVVYAQMTRGKTEKIAAMALATVAATLSRLAYDVCMYMNTDLGFVSFPDALTTGSSIMPHKKNPDVFELIRAKCNRLQALPNELTLLTNNLPSGYHRDMQLTKEIIFPAFNELGDCLQMTAFMLQHIEVKENAVDDDKYKYLFSVEAVNEEVMKGTPFREAYKKVGKEIELGVFKSSLEVDHTHKGSIGNLCNKEIRERMEALLQEF
ncbi:MAG TPA: argininosuccinate lyase [Bacteroidia bacterium]|jgi:argininosuccinate lyase